MKDTHGEQSTHHPDGAEGIDRAIDIGHLENAAEQQSGSENGAPAQSEKTALVRSAKDWGALIGKVLTIAIIAVVTAWNGMHTYFSDLAMEKRQQELEKLAEERIEVVAQEREEITDEGYKLLARTVNVHTDQLKRTEAVVKRLENLADYVEWKHEQDAKRYGSTRLNRMVERFIADVEQPSQPDLDQDELIARIVQEIAEQKSQKGKPVELPRKLGHIPEDPEFFK